MEAAVFAGDLIKQGAIGTPIHVDGFGPHRVGDPASRPDWFFEKEKYGGILCDIGSHQIEQFLYYCDVKDATIQYSQVGNYNHPDHPELEDFGDAILLGDNGTTEHFRVDWFTPEGLSTWGDGRTFILGTEGYIELRKYVNVGTNDGTSNHVFLVNKEGEQHFEVTGKVGYPYFGQLILDCINRTENAMTQEHAFKAAELCVKAEMQAKLVKSANCKRKEQDYDSSCDCRLWKYRACSYGRIVDISKALPGGCFMRYLSRKGRGNEKRIWFKLPNLCRS